MTRWRDIPHLVRRFFGSFRARRPDPEAQSMVAAALSDGEAELFWAQPVVDQAHAVRVARRLRAVAPDRDDLLPAALLHDVGKQDARLGTVGRSMATLCAMVGLPRTRRMRRYLDHAAVGADELRSVGSAPVTVAFAAHHHETAAEGVDPKTWALLREADHE